jgi:hypothetical protein
MLIKERIMKLFKLNYLYFSNNKYKDNIKNLIDSNNKDIDVSYNINKITKFYYTHDIPIDVIDSVSCFSKVTRNLQKQEHYNNNIILNQMKRLEVSLILHNVISRKEANVVFNNDLLINVVLNISCIYNVYRKLILGSYNNDNDLYVKHFEHKTILGFLFMALVITRDIVNDRNFINILKDKYNKIIERIIKHKDRYMLADFLLRDIYKYQDITGNVKPHFRHLYISQSLNIINKGNDILDIYLHPFIYNIIPDIKYFILSFINVDILLLIESMLPGTKINIVDNKHPNSIYTANIINALNANIISLVNNTDIEYGNVINKEYTKHRSKYVLAIDVKTFLEYYSGKIDNFTTNYLGVTIIQLATIKEFVSKYDIYLNFTGVDDLVVTDILSQISYNINYYDECKGLKFILDGLNLTNRNLVYFLKHVIKCFFIECDINPETGNSHYHDFIDKEKTNIDKVNNKYNKNIDLWNLCSINQVGDMEYDYIDDKTDDEHKPLVVDKTLKKEYLNIKEDNIINIISGLKRVVKHKSYKGFVVLLNGESGVGKSKLAEIIAKELNFTIRKISCGDILSKYVGEAEANVKSVISNNDSKSVLLLDEVDGMLPDRENSQMQYEKSLTSEWLSQLDNPVGIIILTTNYKRALDKALLRRINLKLTLEDLSNDTIPKILRSKVKEFDLKRDVNINNISDGLNGLRIGDVGVVDKLVIYNGINTLSKYIDRLKSEIKERTPNNKNKVGLL